MQTLFFVENLLLFTHYKEELYEFVHDVHGKLDTKQQIEEKKIITFLIMHKKSTNIHKNHLKLKLWLDNIQLFVYTSIHYHAADKFFSFAITKCLEWICYLCKYRTTNKNTLPSVQPRRSSDWSTQSSVPSQRKSILMHCRGRLSHCHSFGPQLPSGRLVSTVLPHTVWFGLVWF